MKKIISILAAFALMASASSMAFAAIPADASAPTATVSAVRGSGTDGALVEYQITVDLADLGTLSQTGSNSKATGTKIVQVDLVLESDAEGIEDAYIEDASDSALGDHFDYSGYSAEKGGFFISYVYANRAAYPSGNGAEATDCEGAIVLTMYVPDNTTVTLGQAKVGYGSFENGSASGSTAYLPLTVSPSTLTFGESGGEEPPVPTDPTVSAELFGQGKWDNGYIWTATVSPNNNDITSFEATFTDNATGDTKTASIFNAAALEKYGTAADFSFKVGLKTDKTLSAASFGVNGLDQASVPVSK